MNLVAHNILKPLFAGGLLTLLPLAAQGPRPEGAHSPDPGRALPGLNLTDGQKASLKAIGDKHRPNLEALRKGTMGAQLAFQKAMSDPASKDADLKALNTRLSDARFAEMMEQRAMMKESQIVFTPQQLALLEKMKMESQKPQNGRGGSKHKGKGPTQP
jgi:hypothetical protein